VFREPETRRTRGLVYGRSDCDRSEGDRLGGKGMGSQNVYSKGTKQGRGGFQEELQFRRLKMRTFNDCEGEGRRND